MIDDAIDYLQLQHREEHEKECKELMRHDKSMREIHPKIEREEILFYVRRKGETPSIAMQKAIQAIEDFNKTTTIKKRKK